MTLSLVSEGLRQSPVEVVTFSFTASGVTLPRTVTFFDGRSMSTFSTPADGVGPQNLSNVKLTASQLWQSELLS
jgi:hypothetical protein